MTRVPENPRGSSANPRVQADQEGDRENRHGLLDESSGVVQLLGEIFTKNHFMDLSVSTEQIEQGSVPQSGEPLILAADGGFVFATIENDVRGWWFTAFAA